MTGERINSGPLEAIEGILLRKIRGYRLFLSVEMLSKSASVEADTSAVERLNSGDTNRVARARNGRRGRDVASSPSCALVAG